MIQGGRLPAIEAVLSRLSEFGPSNWAGWISRFINGAPVEPAISRGVDPVHIALNAIYDQLSEPAKRAFSDGLAELLPSAQPAETDPSGASTNAARIYSLFQVATHVAPPQGKAVLFSRLTSEAMRGISYAKWDLHSLLLVACSQFGVDRRLSDYILRSVHSIRDFDYWVICFRMLIKSEPEVNPFLLLEELLPQLSDSDRVDRMAEVLEEALYRNGGWPLLRWFQDVAPQMEMRSLAELDSWGEMVREIVPWPDNPESADIAKLLLAAWVHAPFRTFTAADVKTLLFVLPRSPFHEETEERLKHVMERLWTHGRYWECIDGWDETDVYNRLEGNGDFVRLIVLDERGKRTDVKLWLSDSRRELAFLKSVEGSLPSRPTYRQRTRRLSLVARRVV
jgi:hypothetical protein